MRPAVKIVFAPLFYRNKKEREEGKVTHGEALRRTVKLDPRSSDIGKTLLHELLHVRNPSWSEQAVVTETNRKWKKMSWKEKARMLRLLGSATLEGESQ